MLIEIITLFPDGLRAMLDESIVARAQRMGAIQLELVQLRDFTNDKHRTVDDKPFGGGPGMVLKADPVAKALDHLIDTRPEPKPLIISTSPQGKQLTQELVENLATRDRIQIICGHYKGLDQRVIDSRVDLEISIGDYILTGGEPAALVIADAVSRLQKGVLGDPESAETDSFTRGLLDHSHYTQPASWEGMDVPDLLLSGHHARIAEWRKQETIVKTKKLRPDIYEKWLAQGKKDS